MSVKRLKLIFVFLCLNLIAGAREYRALILPVQFKDLSFSYGAPQFNSLADSLTLYFNAQFRGEAGFRFDIGPLVTLQKSYIHYSANDSEGPDAKIAQAVVEACAEVDGEVDFAAYSTNGRTVDKLLLLLPGKSETDSADVNLFWPRYFSLDDSGQSFTADGVHITHCGIFTEKGPNGEFTGIGNAAHEFGHAMGLNDFYDTDGERSGGLSKGLWGCLDLMDRGNRNGGGHLPPNLGAVCLYLLGAGQAEIAENPGRHLLEPLGESGHFMVVKNPEKEEFFTLENRKPEGNDALLGGSGLMICHVNRSTDPAGYSDFYKMELNAYERWEKNQINCNPAHQCVALVPADTSSIAAVFFPSEGHGSFGPETTPPFLFKDGTPSPYSLLNISREGDNISFDLVRPIQIVSTDIFQTTAILSWIPDKAIGKVAGSSILAIDGADTVSIVPCRMFSDSLFSGAVTGLNPNKEYRLKLLVRCEDGSLHSAVREIKTHPYRSNVYPFIFLKTGERNADGSFPPGTRIPLQVFNAPDAVEIHWYMNGREISAELEGYRLMESGELKVELYRKDGSKEIIMKEISIR